MYIRSISDFDGDSVFELKIILFKRIDRDVAGFIVYFHGIHRCFTSVGRRLESVTVSAAVRGTKGTQKPLGFKPGKACRVGGSQSQNTVLGKS